MIVSGVPEICLARTYDMAAPFALPGNAGDAIRCGGPLAIPVIGSAVYPDAFTVVTHSPVSAPP